jgi:hypothetical protein
MLSLFHQTEKEYELRNELVKELVEWTVSDDSLPNLQKKCLPASGIPLNSRNRERS